MPTISSAISGANALGLAPGTPGADLASAVQDETEEERKKRLRQMMLAGGPGAALSSSLLGGYGGVGI